MNKRNGYLCILCVGLFVDFESRTGGVDKHGDRSYVATATNPLRACGTTCSSIPLLNTKERCQWRG